MDKNTIWGALLMGAVILGFMWLNKPSEEELARQKELAEQQARDEKAQSPDNDILTVDSISPAEREVIASTIKQFGTPDSTAGTYTVHTNGATVTLGADGSLSGTVSTASGAVTVADILSHNVAATGLPKLSEAVKVLKKDLADIARYQGFARYLHGDSTTVRLANKLVTLEISNKGGRIARAILNDYKTYDSTAVELISPATDGYSFTLTSSTRRFNTGEFYFKPVEVTDTAVTMQLDLGDGATWAMRYTLRPDSYVVDLDILQQGMSAIIPPSVASMDFTWHSMMQRTEAGRMFEERNSALYFKEAGGGVDYLKETSDDAVDLSQRVKWIAYKNQFFSAIFVARTNFTTARMDSKIMDASTPYMKDLTTEATMEYSSTLANPASFSIFLGPNLYPLMNDLQDELAPGEDLQFTKLIPLGWTLFRWINTIIIIPVFTFLGSFISNYGLIILLLTVFIKLILFPFTYKSYMSQAKMRVLSPEIQAINDKYPGNENAMKRQQETMALYSRAGASPFSGCLPLLLQMPILIAMFQFFPSAIELRGQSFLWAHDLSAPDAIVSWTANIPLISSTFGNHISLFCLLMTVTNIIYTRINMQSQPTGNSMPGMKWMMYLMPLMFLVFFNNYAAGLSYYYFLSLLITIVQTYAVRRVVDEDKVRAAMAANARKNKGKKKSGFMARLEEAQRRQQAMLREQEKQRGKRR